MPSVGSDGQPGNCVSHRAVLLSELLFGRPQRICRLQWQLHCSRNYSFHPRQSLTAYGPSVLKSQCFYSGKCSMYSFLPGALPEQIEETPNNRLIPIIHTMYIVALLNTLSLNRRWQLHYKYIFRTNHTYTVVLHEFHIPAVT